ncbi:hypothetical protein AJ85_21530 [Alkalihalobacillus alcalophilus ATCC 27647 = CGMCC 1.3604]|uniref:M23ase beta-sheet core domain-containing protein n=1 Tax=Alkalihalobacillus alcalophilus ATCC 27647 = CGMCC 1.3604 TaxID=1218173 RepID=A0A094XE51_ALKAL|nr:M23 family metallopeptidase [Alkalihalobacillus alcalophilus]KGA97065.1 hypothetical protein BALCAV_0212565 [Alkalihalobacillus alcalophilus ATCC 27647 = CGMCC 1.3604]MED1561098.1 peptidoglycan DD-metalloendopeptidase family protein [Alkalihalobacillus alcalophilus]THG92000.1 hypothetical protein AJ85_21530 [Alkalihalobacillus alcalophilus ATCC 27647 = CGMCC 1.3604]
MREDENKRSSEEKTLSVQVKRLMRKRWVAPALYLVVAAGILSAVFILNGQEESTNPDGEVEINDPSFVYDEEAVEAAVSNEVLKMPADESEVELVGFFYDHNGTSEEKQAALVSYNSSFHQNFGLDYAMPGAEDSFDVTAALTGTVVKAEKQPIFGYVVELNHKDGLVTYYHSLANLDVTVGDTVNQGEILGQAGRNEYNKDAGVHVHFELRYDGVQVNPTDLFQQPIDAIFEVVQSDEDGKEAEDKDGKEEEPAEGSEQPTENTPTDTEDPADKEDEDSDQEEDGAEDANDADDEEAVESIGNVTLLM